MEMMNHEGGMMKKKNGGQTSNSSSTVSEGMIFTNAYANHIKDLPFSQKWCVPDSAYGNDAKVQAGCLHHKPF